ncbi:MAG: hypothetical protein JNJ56_02950 [Ignavibacteria bacterium]|nr:hypothetical protein [Ignavibacteria bacterium]
MPTESIIEKVKETAGNLTEKVEEFKEDLWGEEQKLIIEEFRDSSVEKVKAMLSNINNSNELFDKSGFHLQNLKVSLGIPPVISVEFSIKGKISTEERARLLEDIKENNMIKLIVICLFKASDFYDKIQFGNYKLSLIEIELGLIPGINLEFSNG